MKCYAIKIMKPEIHLLKEDAEINDDLRGILIFTNLGTAKERAANQMGCKTYADAVKKKLCKVVEVEAMVLD